MKASTIRTVTALALLGIAGWANGATLYEQPPERVDGMPALFNGTLGLALLDDFTVSDAGSVHEIVWWGGFAGDDAPAAASYAISLYGAAESGAPGSLLFRDEVNFSDGAGTDTGFFATPGLGDFRVYEYRAELSQTWELAADTVYFLGIQELNSANSLWLTASAGGGRYAVSSATGSALQTGWDFAFSLRGIGPDEPGQANPVPAPAAGGLAAAGAAGMALVRVFRRRKGRGPIRQALPPTSPGT